MPSAMTIRLSDDDRELLETELTIDDPAALPGLLDRLPTPCPKPHILGRYDKNSTPDYPLVYCAHCRGSHHRRGFLVEFSGIGEALIGARTCGKEAFGFDWNTAENNFSSLEVRQGDLERLAAAAACIEGFTSDLIALSEHPSPLSYDVFVSGLSKSAFGRRLASTARSDGSLMVDVEVRDEHADRERVRRSKPELLDRVERATSPKLKRKAQREVVQWATALAPHASRHERRKVGFCDGYGVLQHLRLASEVAAIAAQAEPLPRDISARSWEGPLLAGMLARLRELAGRAEAVQDRLATLQTFTAPANVERLLAWRLQVAELRGVEMPSLTLPASFEIPVLPGVGAMRGAIGR